MPFGRGGYHRKPMARPFFEPAHSALGMLGPRRPARKPAMQVMGEAINPRRPARMGLWAWIKSLLTWQPKRRRPPQPPNPAQMAQMEQMQQMELAEEQQ